MSGARYELAGVEESPNPEPLDDLEGFIADNGFEPDEAQALRALAVGETYQGGGGAAPVWAVRRVS